MGIMARRTDIRIKTTLSQSGRTWFADPRSVKRVNAGLLRAATRCRPLPLDGASLVYHHIHIGAGVLKKRRDRRWHAHDEIQIEYAVFGRFLFRTRREERRIGPGEGLVVARQMEHGFDTIEDGGLVGVLVEIDGPRREEFIRHVDRCAAGGFLPFGSD